MATTKDIGIQNIHTLGPIAKLLLEFVELGICFEGILSILCLARFTVTIIAYTLQVMLYETLS